ncbi:hypothetical protein C802_01956 [Phocaeicola sartorii]|uniref:Uncharacterized protein n=1 Tax=Phocaeicola sartorii TaxID=671267 RepID=R9I8L2_9BACT|nr:hypothetical protein C802_01956 [Phocaeicola sartorii]
MASPFERAQIFIRISHCNMDLVHTANIKQGQDYLKMSKLNA